MFVSQQLRGQSLAEAFAFKLSSTQSVPRGTPQYTFQVGWQHQHPHFYCHRSQVKESDKFLQENVVSTRSCGSRKGPRWTNVLVSHVDMRSQKNKTRRDVSNEHLLAQMRFDQPARPFAAVTLGNLRDTMTRCAKGGERR